MVKCTALDLAPHGVRVNSVNPGVIVTDIHRRAGQDEETYARFLEHSKTTHPIGFVSCHVPSIAWPLQACANSYRKSEGTPFVAVVLRAAVLETQRKSPRPYFT